jgi:hypothetical protein
LNTPPPPEKIPGYATGYNVLQHEVIRKKDTKCGTFTTGLKNKKKPTLKLSLSLLSTGKVNNNKVRTPPDFFDSRTKKKFDIVTG